MEEGKSDKFIQLLAIAVVVLLVIIGYVMNFRSDRGIVFTKNSKRTHYDLERFSSYSHNITQSWLTYRNGYYLLHGYDRYAAYDEDDFITVFFENQIVKDEAIDVREFTTDYGSKDAGLFYRWQGENYHFYDYANEGLSTEQYEYLSYIKDDYFIAKRNGKEGIIRKNGQVILPFEYTGLAVIAPYYFEYTDLSTPDNGAHFVTTDYLYGTKEDKRGVLNFKGQVIIPVEYDDVHIALGEEKQIFFFLTKGNQYSVVTEKGKLIIESNREISYDNRIHRFYVVKEDKSVDFYSLKGEFLKNIPREENWGYFYDEQVTTPYVYADSYSSLYSDLVVIPDKASLNTVYLMDKDLTIKKLDNVVYEQFDGMNTDYTYYATSDFYVLKENDAFSLYQYQTGKLKDTYASIHIYRNYAVTLCKEKDKACAIYDLKKKKFVTKFAYEFIPYKNEYYGNIGYLKKDNHYILYLDYENELTCEADTDVSLLAGGLRYGNVYMSSERMLYDKNCKVISEKKLRNVFRLDNQFIVAEEWDGAVTVGTTDYYTYEIFNPYHKIITYNNEDQVKIIMYLGYANKRLFFLTDNGIYTMKID